MVEFFSISKDVIFIILFIAFILYLPKFIYFTWGFVPSKKYSKSDKLHKMAFLLPARNESEVIEDLLISISKQTYDKSKFDTFIIVTEPDDPTIEIAKKYENTYCYVIDREKKGKGRALDFGIHKLKEQFGDIYDAFLIVDADNTVKEDFVEKMNDVFSEGYDIVVGKKINKSWKEGWVSNCSALTFTFVDTLNNKFRSRAGGNVTITGTGLLVSNRIIKEKDGWPFHTITEDYELTLDSVVNNYKSVYCEYAIVSTEEPNDLKVTAIRRLRWLKGHNSVEKMYRKRQYKQLFAKDTKCRFIKFDYIFSLIPIIVAFVSIIIFMLISSVSIIVGLFSNLALSLSAVIALITMLAFVYIILMLYTILALIADKEYIKLTKKQIWEVILLNPFYLLLYVSIYIRSVFQKEVEWTPIAHTLSLKK